MLGWAHARTSTEILGKEEVLLRARFSDGGAGRVKMGVRGLAVEVEASGKGVASLLAVTVI